MNKKRENKLINLANSNVIPQRGLNNEENKNAENEALEPKRNLLPQKPLFEPNMLKPETKEDYLCCIIFWINVI